MFILRDSIVSENFHQFIIVRAVCQHSGKRLLARVKLWPGLIEQAVADAMNACRNLDYFGLSVRVKKQSRTVADEQVKARIIIGFGLDLLNKGFGCFVTGEEFAR